MKTAKELYTQNIERFHHELKTLRSKIAGIAFVRLVSFLIAAWFVYRSFTNADTFNITILITALLIFLGCVKYAFVLNDQKRLLEQLLFINQNEMSVINEQKNSFDNGTRYTDARDYTGDLDIFGAGSLYGLLNRTTTSLGSASLAKVLQSPLLTAQEIIEHQVAIRVLSEQPALRHRVTAAGLLHTETEGTLNEIKTWLLEPNRMQQLKWLQVLRYIVPAFNLWAFYYFLDTDNQGPLLIGLAIAFIIIFSFSKYIFSQHKLVTKKQAILDQYAGILKEFSSADAGHSKLVSRLTTNAGKAGLSIYQLARLASAFDQRLNLVVLLFFNGFLLYDIQCMMRLEKWKTSHRDDFDQWSMMVGEIEVLNALASFAFNNPGYTYPLVTDELLIRAVDMSHPLIPADRNVSNSIETGRSEQLVLLTGSNMSGKTTFLRTIGVNLVLAQCGAPVHAAQFTFKPMSILSSIRIGDSLQENTSYFMAELKKLGTIIDTLKTGAPALVLIDEILRGTNSDDKTHGSEQFIRKLLHYNCLTFFATHDLSLGVLQQELSGQVNNYCFESTIVNGELLFDYKLREGVARNKNASFLMEKMGLI